MGCSQSTPTNDRTRDIEPRRENDKRISHTRTNNNTGADYPTYPPPPPRAILADREEYLWKIRQRDKWHQLPRGETKDKPMYALYRMYEYIVLEHVNGYRNEFEWFFRDHPNWKVEDIPDPQDEDPERYAVLSCIPPLLVLAFNNLIKIGLPRDAPAVISWELVETYRNTPDSARKYEKCPSWVRKPSPLSKELVIPTNDGSTWVRPPNDKLEPSFKEKNIIMRAAHIYFI